MAKVTQRITPFVEDRKNCLIVRPRVPLNEQAMVTFQYALARGIEATFQLESSELSVEALPGADHHNAILFYESSEGGAGVLTRMATDLSAMKTVARRALEICHYQSKSGTWTGHKDLKNADPDCEAGCYKCLLSYSNQPNHKIIDRQDEKVLDLLCRLTRCEGERTRTNKSADESLAELKNVSVSSLEQAWLDDLSKNDYRIPDKAQPTLKEYGTQPDFAYSSVPALIYIDGPHHDTAFQKRIDDEISKRLEDAGYTVIRFPKERADWPSIFAEHAYVFGAGKQRRQAAG
jgi:very-short-patch-repair endonuclease